MSESRRLQSEQDMRSQFDSFLADFQGLSSYSIANLLMQYMTNRLIQLSQLHQAVKLAESLTAGTLYVGGEGKAVAEKLDDRLSQFYQSYASQLTMTMLQEKPLLKSSVILNKASESLDKDLSKLSAKNSDLILERKKQLGNDVVSKDVDVSKNEKKDGYTPPKPRR